MMAEEDWGPPFQVEPQEMTLDSDGVTLSLTVWEREPRPIEVPEGKKKPKVKEGSPEAPPRSWCLLVHGLLADRREFGQLGARLAREGLGVVALDLRGHGKSGGPRGVYDPERAVQDIRNVMDHFNTRHEQWDLNPQQWAVIGHSLGGVVALNVGHYLHAGDVVVASCVPRTILEEVNPIKRLGYRLAYAARGRENGGEAGPTLKYEVDVKDCFVDPQAREEARKLGLLQDRIPIRNYPLLSAVDAERVARGVMDPTVLMLASGRDRVVNLRATRAVFEALSTAKTYKEFPGVGHSIWLDGRREEVISYTVDWLKYRLEAFNEVRLGHTKR